MSSVSGVQSGFGVSTGAIGPWIYGRWAEPPAQRRSRRTFYKFLDAAEALLGERPWHEVSVQDIVRSAEASVGAFYNRFSDKAALLHCLDDRLAEECERTVDGLITEMKAAPVLVSEAPAIMVSLFMRLCAQHGGVISALDLSAKMAAPKGAKAQKAKQQKAGDAAETADSVFGLGARFDGALTRFATFLSEEVLAYKGHTAAALLGAFQETFWLTRERIIYRRQDEGARQGLHDLLMRHFAASLHR
ncbi:TetR/AcrR family transcriptional regulator [Kordiimonas marina]|uniref:TetR/AcrR family transcriptional regulator n=1 Tax=Kordiimonas marina TaxID=2872312 RepID=UPI001FF35F57|nr:helix-turn-helix domain-containing protein [Kordiimonas marina]MCJ9428659.1 TetR/AcrR family transcriptional regulator [Kordiimonas marina]